MTLEDIRRQRLQNLLIDGSMARTPLEVVTALGAMQAQDYAGGKWAIGLRIPGATDAGIEAAIADATIIRTWPMRGTLHFVPAADAKWMLALSTPRMFAGAVARLAGLGLTEEDIAASQKAMVAALSGGAILTRDELLKVIDDSGVPITGQRGYHLLWRSSQVALTCFGPPRGKQQTFVLFDEWVTKSNALTREESLATLARRFFTSHGPATPQDFARWTGLTAADCRVGLEGAAARLARDTIGKQVYWTAPGTPSPSPDTASIHLLPGFDELMLGYKDRSPSLDPIHADKIVPGGNGVFKPTIVVDGQVVGTWRRAEKRSGIAIALDPFEPPLSPAMLKSIEAAVVRYGEYMGVPAVISA